MSDNEARRLGLILTAITVLLAAISIVSSIYFYAPSEGDIMRTSKLEANSANYESRE